MLSALGLGLIVYGVLRSGTWGLVQSKAGAPEWLGLSPVIWLILAGGWCCGSFCGGRITGWRAARPRLAVADAIFGFLVPNVLGSGIYDLATGTNTRVPVPGIHLFIGWHSLSSLLFLGYLIAHVIRRRKRLRRSQIR